MCLCSAQVLKSFCCVLQLYHWTSGLSSTGLLEPHSVPSCSCICNIHHSPAGLQNSSICERTIRTLSSVRLWFRMFAACLWLKTVNKSPFLFKEVIMKPCASADTTEKCSMNATWTEAAWRKPHDPNGSDVQRQLDPQSAEPDMLNLASPVCVCVCVHMSGVSVYMSVSWTEPLDRKQEAPSHTVNIESVDSLPCVFLLKVLFGFQWIYVGYSAVWLHRCQLLSVGPDWNISAASEGVHWNLIQTITRKKIWFELPEKSDLTYLSFLADLNRMWKMIEHRLIFQKVEKGRKI